MFQNVFKTGIMDIKTNIKEFFKKCIKTYQKGCAKSYRVATKILETILIGRLKQFLHSKIELKIVLIMNISLASMIFLLDLFSNVF